MSVIAIAKKKDVRVIACADTIRKGIYFYEFVSFDEEISSYPKKIISESIHLYDIYSSSSVLSTLDSFDISESLSSKLTKKITEYFVLLDSNRLFFTKNLPYDESVHYTLNSLRLNEVELNGEKEAETESLSFFEGFTKSMTSNKEDNISFSEGLTINCNIALDDSLLISESFTMTLTV